jgi:hypothetical protein
MQFTLFLLKQSNGNSTNTLKTNNVCEQGMNVSDSIANNDQMEVQPIVAAPTTAVSILVDAPPTYFTDSFHGDDQGTPLGAEQRRYIC